jgi:hypothetical protein
LNEPTTTPRGADDQHSSFDADGPDAQEATQGQSVVAPANDDHTDPAAVNHASSPAEPPAAGDQPAPKLPPAQCQSCGATVKREDIESYEGKPPCHRRKRNKTDLVGDLCGPVISVWIYHVAYSVSGSIHSARTPLLQPIEMGNSLDIAAQQLSAAEGQPVEVLWWSLLMGA